MADKIVTVRTDGPGFRTVETPAIKMFGRCWINGAAFERAPTTPLFYDSAARHFVHPRNLDNWHWARVAAALKRNPQCR